MKNNVVHDGIFIMLKREQFFLSAGHELLFVLDDLWDDFCICEKNQKLLFDASQE